MPCLTLAKQKKYAQKFAHKIAFEGKTKAQAYKDLYPACKDSSTAAAGTRYSQRPMVQEYIEKAVSEIDSKSVFEISQAIVKDAKKATKDVVYNSDGATISVKDNQATATAREQFFKLVGHPGFVKNVNFNVDARQVNISSSDVDNLTSTITKMIEAGKAKCAQTGSEEYFT